MAIKIDVASGLQQLAATRNHILEHLEWDRLVSGEVRPHVPPGFLPQTSMRQHLVEDMRDMYHLFLSLASDIRQVLARSDLVCTSDERRCWHHRLDRLEGEVLGLGIGERISVP